MNNRTKAGRNPRCNSNQVFGWSTCPLFWKLLNPLNLLYQETPRPKHHDHEPRGVNTLRALLTMDSTIHLSSPDWLTSNHPHWHVGPYATFKFSTNHFSSVVQYLSSHVAPLFLYICSPSLSSSNRQLR